MKAEEKMKTAEKMIEQIMNDLQRESMQECCGKCDEMTDPIGAAAEIADRYDLDDCKAIAAHLLLHVYGADAFLDEE